MLGVGKANGGCAKLHDRIYWPTALHSLFFAPFERALPIFGAWPGCRREHARSYRYSVEQHQVDQQQTSARVRQTFSSGPAAGVAR